MLSRIGETGLIMSGDIIGMHAGYPLVVHAPGRCGGEMCCIHNPSAHALSDRPLHWRDDRAIMERICVHGVGHPDPDDAAWRKRSGRDPDGWDNVHGCDGCCTSLPPTGTLDTSNGVID